MDARIKLGWMFLERSIFIVVNEYISVYCMCYRINGTNISLLSMFFNMGAILYIYIILRDAPI